LQGSDGISFLTVPEREPKPRSRGLTHVLDKGLSLSQIEGLFDTAGEYVDIVKLGWGTSYVTNNLEEKLALYRSLGTPVVCGGTLFEAVHAQGKLDEFKRWLTHFRFSHVEISDGALDIPRVRKLELIADFARDFVVLSEVGSKDEEQVYPPFQWVEWIGDELAAGAWKVIAEGRENGTAGIYRPTGELRTGLVDEIEHSISCHDLIWEAPSKAAQAWFVKRFGHEVNLGNIPPDEVIALETLRLGLRADTLRELLLGALVNVLPIGKRDVPGDGTTVEGYRSRGLRTDALPPSGAYDRPRTKEL
jgi:phosphosulfolactate synthase